MANMIGPEKLQTGLWCVKIRSHGSDMWRVFRFQSERKARSFMGFAQMLLSQGV